MDSPRRIGAINILGRKGPTCVCVQHACSLCLPQCELASASEERTRYTRSSSNVYLHFPGKPNHNHAFLSEYATNLLLFFSQGLLEENKRLRAELEKVESAREEAKISSLRLHETEARHLVDRMNLIRH